MWRWCFGRCFDCPILQASYPSREHLSDQGIWHCCAFSVASSAGVRHVEGECADAPALCHQKVGTLETHLVAIRWHWLYMQFDGNGHQKVVFISLMAILAAALPDPSANPEAR